MNQHGDAPVVIIVGTRPEGIKLIPLYCALKKAGVSVVLCSTVQHTELLSEVFDLFGVIPDISLNVMRPGQDLFYLTQAVLQKTKELFIAQKPSLVIVQGDTTSAMAAGMAAFYLKIPIAHIEAGLRTNDLGAPFPEEMNRRILRVLSTYHFAPTSWAAAQLMKEGVNEKQIFCVGNTVVDALRMIKHKIAQQEVCVSESLRTQLHRIQKEFQKSLLFTMHRRESFNGDVSRIFKGLYHWLSEHPHVFCFYPYHPNPSIIAALQDSGFAQLKNVLLLEPLSYKDMAYVLDSIDYVLTDSGGIQEEAVSIGKPVIVLREKTERIEAVWSGAAQLVGTDVSAILDALDRLDADKTMATMALQLFGDGYAAEKIVHILKERINFNTVKMDSMLRISYGAKKEAFNMKKVVVFGLGYIGLPTSIVLAEAGYTVHGVDLDEKKLAAIQAGDPVIKEPELYEKMQVVLRNDNFTVSRKVVTADYFIIAVPTPFTHDKKADLSHVYDAVTMLLPVIKCGDTVIIESTIPVKTTMRVASLIAQKTNLVAGEDFFVVHCPERVLPGNIFHELVHNARILGGINKSSLEKAKELYASFVKGELYLTDADTAELVKLVENSSRDAQIAFAHQVASMATRIGLDPYEVIELANKHPRVSILNPSCGVGGHCLAVDPWFLVETFKDDARYLKLAREINDNRPREVVEQIKNSIACWTEKLNKKPVVALCGMTYKPEVDDLRESPALKVAQMLKEYDICICEPNVSKDIVQKYVESPVLKYSEALERADIVVFLVAHKRFLAIDDTLLANKQVLDFCGLMHVQKQSFNQQEYYFWPARKKNTLSSNSYSSTEQQI